jgi:hypothetical protein
MNYNDKKNDKLEMDDMKIKSHLNTSLDLSGISVSEDLINRTLEAIKKQPAETQGSQVEKEETTNKVIPWNKYVRGFAGVAAAVLVIVAGYNLLSRGTMKYSKSDNSADSSVAEEFTTMDAVTEETAEEDMSFSSATESTTADEGTADTEAADSNEQLAVTENEIQASRKYTIAADISFEMDEDKSVTGSDGVVAGGEGSVEPESPAQRNGDGVILLSFREIFLPDPSQAEYIEITDDVNNTSITLVTPEEILEFYTMMDKHQFTYSDGTSSEQNYTVEVKNPIPETLYTMTIGETIIIQYNSGENVSESRYSSTDAELLQQNLEEFYQKYRD